MTVGQDVVTANVVSTGFTEIYAIIVVKRDVVIQDGITSGILQENYTSPAIRADVIFHDGVVTIISNNYTFIIFQDTVPCDSVIVATIGNTYASTLHMIQYVIKNDGIVARFNKQYTITIIRYCISYYGIIIA
jgi:hypothetical protein